MASSTKIGALATFVVKSAGNAVPDEMRILKVHVEKFVNRISTAVITILDGDATTGKFEASSSSNFAPGTEISIEAGYDSQNTAIFTGIVTRQTIRIDEFNGSLLEVECRDKAIKMVVGRKSLTYSKKKDSDIIQTLIGNYSGLSSSVTATDTVWPEQVQYYVSDWDYMLARAEANGLIVTTLNGKVSVFKPDATTTSVLTVKYGDGLFTFNADLNSVNQLGSSKASAWDYKTQAVVSGQASDSFSGAGNLTSKKLSDVVGLSDYQLQTTAPLETADLTNWSKAQLVKSDYSKIIGEARFQGSSAVDPAKYMTMQGVGDRFNGDYLIAGVVHDLSEGNWVTEVKLGLSPTWFTEEPDVMAPPASGLLPAARGLFNATVKKIDQDPDSQYRILVTIPLFDQNGDGIWARLTNFYSTSGAGAFFLPEVGDEVVVGFLNEDPRFPIILGSMYSSSKLKPFTGLDPNNKNSLKAIVSKKGMYVQFDDENVVFTINTPKKNTMIFSDKDGKITIQDQNQNSFEMSSSGITMKSPKNISIQADQKVSISGMQGVTIESSGGDVSITGMNIKESANVEYSAQGSATAKVSGGAELMLKGAMVMIN